MRPNLPLHVLLVEDDEVDIEFMRRGLEAAGPRFSVTVVRNGIEALNLLRGQHGQRPRQPCLLLLDLNLPMMNGLEVLYELRRDPALRRQIVFVLTTSDLEQDRVAAYEHQVAGYLLKSKLDRSFTTLLNLLEAYRNSIEFPPE